jgi:hypothetical protein
MFGTPLSNAQTSEQEALLRLNQQFNESEPEERLDAQIQPNRTTKKVRAAAQAFYRWLKTDSNLTSKRGAFIREERTFRVQSHLHTASKFGSWARVCPHLGQAELVNSQPTNSQRKQARKSYEMYHHGGTLSLY